MCPMGEDLLFCESVHMVRSHEMLLFWFLCPPVYFWGMWQAILTGLQSSDSCQNSHWWSTIRLPFWWLQQEVCTVYQPEVSHFDACQSKDAYMCYCVGCCWSKRNTRNEPVSSYCTDEPIFECCIPCQHLTAATAGCVTSNISSNVPSSYWPCQ